MGEKKLLEKFLAEPNKLVQLIRSEEVIIEEFSINMEFMMGL